MKLCQEPKDNATGRNLSLCIVALLAACCLTAFAYRAYVVVGIQAVARTYCESRSAETAAEYPNGHKLFNYKNFLDACTSIEMRDYRELYFDLDDWTFESAYPSIVKMQRFSQKMEALAKDLKQQAKLREQAK